MQDDRRYYELAEQAAKTGEISFLTHCIDEILRRSTETGARPEFGRIFKTLFEARLHFLHLHTDRENDFLSEEMPEDIAQRLRDLDALSSALQTIAEGQPVADAVQRIQRLGAHPIRPK